MTQTVWPELIRNRAGQIHLVGIGGVGMAAIAEVLLQEGFCVTGSDLRASPLVQRLESLGADIQLQHSPDKIKTAQVLVRSTAITDENPEIQYAAANGIMIISRAQMLAEIMRFRYGIAVSGTHGKTTTSSMIAWLLEASELDPTFIIGGRVHQFNSHAKVGRGAHLVAEADESDASFLCLSPMVCVVTNIDWDHAETYEGDINTLYQAYTDFVHRLPFYGQAILGLDSPHVRAWKSHINRQYQTYGFCEDADLRALNVVETPGEISADLTYHQQPLGRLTLPLNGRHILQNAMATCLVGMSEGLSFESIQMALQSFKGVARRFDVYPNITVNATTPVTIMDDYAHHPEEMAVTLAAAQARWQTETRHLIFQPHRYSRLAFLWEDFIEVLKTAPVDKVWLLPTYAAGESPLENICHESLAQAVGDKAMAVPSFEACVNGLVSASDNEAVWVFMGAGSIGGMVQSLVKDASLARAAP